jgi:hypothetical protein
VRISIIAFLVFSVIAIPLARADPTTQPTTQSSIAPDPAAVMRDLFRAVENADRKKALTDVQASTPVETQVAGSQIDMMLAVARLKKAIRAKIGPIDPTALQMAIVSDSEYASIVQSITGDGATVTAKSTDDPTWTTDYDMVRVNGIWRLSLARNMQDVASNAPIGLMLAQTARLIKAVNDTAGAVARGDIKTTDDVTRKISEALARAAGG